MANVLYGTKPTTKPAPDEVTNSRSYWADEITKAEKRYGVFQRAGSNVVDRFRLERADEAENSNFGQDKYNMLYTTVETTKPSLYAQTPKVEATKRHKDRTNDLVSMATELLETACQYALEEVDFDGVMKNVVQDYLLPGMGLAWVRYDPKIGVSKSDDGTDVETLDGEAIGVDYVYFKDFVTGVGRTWLELPWIARRVYFNKAKATKRFGKEKADALTYTYRPADNGNGNKEFAGSGGEQAIIWEIWNKDDRTVLWFSTDYATDLLDKRDDMYKLKNFWPCPEPIRAVWTTRTFIPKSFYAQYKAQAEELDNLTQRIRYLTKALRIVGLYDGTQEQLKNILTGNDNKLVPVQNWSDFAQKGGIQGSVQWMPIKEIAEVLLSLLNQRDIVKGEIYEITGFSDIVRGVSKASETLGAQKIKADWAGGRLRDMQKEVQRFCRDIIRIISEIVSEEFSEETLAEYAGFDPPPITDEEQQAAAQYTAAKAQHSQLLQQHAAHTTAALTLPNLPPPPAPPQEPVKPPPTAQAVAIQTFQKVVKLLKSEKQRCAQIGIETDSTIMPDEAGERKDRMDFLGAAGAFLQQAGPMAAQYPEMRGLLGSLLMFTVRTFRASRPIEKDFEQFAAQVQNMPPPAPKGGTGAAPVDPAVEHANAMALQQAKSATDVQLAQEAAAAKKYEIDSKAELERIRLANEQAFKLAELDIRRREVEVAEGTLRVTGGQMMVDAVLRQGENDHQRNLDLTNQAHEQAMDVAGTSHDQAMDVTNQAHDQAMDQQAAAAAATAAAQPPAGGADSA